MDDDETVTATFGNSCDGNTGIGCREDEEDEDSEETPPP